MTQDTMIHTTNNPHEEHRLRNAQYAPPQKKNSSYLTFFSELPPFKLHA
jgi:hypothetical protein